MLDSSFPQNNLFYFDLLFPVFERLHVLSEFHPFLHDVLEVLQLLVVKILLQPVGTIVIQARVEEGRIGYLLSPQILTSFWRFLIPHIKSFNYS